MISFDLVRNTLAWVSGDQELRFLLRNLDTYKDAQRPQGSRHLESIPLPCPIFMNLTWLQ